MEPSRNRVVGPLLGAWLLTGIVDGTFSSVLSAGFYGSTVGRLWQGVASVPFGAKALEGGTTYVLIGLLLHFGVALGWSIVFLVGLLNVGWLRRLVAGPGGVMKAAVLYGPLIWLVMSLVVIPMLAHRPPNITYRWWIQLFGHIPFVALPIAAMLAPVARSRLP